MEVIVLSFPFFSFFLFFFTFPLLYFVFFLLFQFVFTFFYLCFTFIFLYVPFTFLLLFFFFLFLFLKNWRSLFPGMGFLITMLTSISFLDSFTVIFWKLRRSKDFNKLYLEYCFEDTGLQRYPLSTKDFCIFLIRTSIIKRQFFEGLIFVFFWFHFSSGQGGLKEKQESDGSKSKKYQKS